MDKISVGDVELRFLDRGAGKTLLLVHGFPLDHTMWDEQIEGLSDEHRVIAPDLRGFGQSDVTEGTVTMQQFADDLAALLDGLEITEPVVFCGLSMGGYIAWQFVQRHAPRVSHLILCDTRAIADSEDVARNRLEFADRVLKEGALPVAEMMLPRLFAESTVAANPPIVAATQSVMVSTRPAAIAAALRGMAQREDVTSRLGEIKIPTLVICGEHDAISPASEMQGIAEAIPNARYVEIKGAGHMSPLEDPDHVNDAIREFLANA